MDKGCKCRISKNFLFARLSLCGILLGLLLGACTSLSDTSPYTTEPISSREPASAPPWARMKPSWGKLAAIENWLQSSAGLRSDYWWAEGQLELNEGRLEFSRQDLAKGPETPAVRARLTKARRGFTTVKTNIHATQLQRKRARRGLTQLDNLHLGTRSATVTGTLISRNKWGARSARRNEMTPSRNRFSRITVHHSADSISPNLDGSLASSGDALRRFQTVHMDGPKTGYGDIGYHFLIDSKGRLFEGRQLAWQGAHAGNSSKNRENIGVCLLGNFETRRPTRAALSTLDKTLGKLRREYGISNRKIFGHQDFKNTLCPGKHLMSWVRSYSAR